MIVHHNSTQHMRATSLGACRRMGLAPRKAPHPFRFWMTVPPQQIYERTYQCTCVWQDPRSAIAVGRAARTIVYIAKKTLKTAGEVLVWLTL